MRHRAAGEGTERVSTGRPGWFDDPYRRFQKRYWNGQAWTSLVMNGDQAGSDPDFDEPASTGAPPFTTSTQEHSGPHGTFTSLDPSGVCRELPPRLSAHGVGIVSVAPDRIQGRTLTGASMGAGEIVLAIILLILCVIPGVIYLVWALNRKRTIPFTLTLIAQGRGTVIVPHPLEINWGPVGMALQGLPR